MGRRAAWLALAFATPAFAHPTSLAGRGGNQETPEHTLTAYDHSLDAGMEFLELDVWLSADGVPVCIHDATVDRTTDGTGLVYTKTLAELEQLDAGSWFAPEFTGEQIPTLAQALQLTLGRGRVLIDVKQTQGYAVVAQVATDVGFPFEDIWSFQRGFDPDLFRDNFPGGEIVTNWVPSSDEKSIRNQALAGDRGLVVPWTHMNAALVERVHAYGLVVWTWAAPSQFQSMTDMGTNGLITGWVTPLSEFLPGPDPECGDGVDNDGDGDTDFPDDAGCFGPEDDSEYAECSDGVDNDGDGDTDFPDDAGCFDAFSPLEAPECQDGIDNDGDGRADLRDLDCFDTVDQRERSRCGDGLDNDLDGLVDFPDDPGCTHANDASEEGPTMECDDGVDNDGDGLVDFPEDAGCADADDSSERNAAVECDDGIDNDGDGVADLPDDPGCSDAGDTWEGNAAVECDDGVDNDGDTAIDYPSDSGCHGLADLSESVDMDGDGFDDANDVCPAVPNVHQTDSDGDGIGNACDTDYDNDGLVGGSDYVALSVAHGSKPGDPRYDRDIDNSDDPAGDAIAGPEFVLLSGQFGGPPGPGLPGCDGTLPPPSGCQP